MPNSKPNIIIYHSHDTGRWISPYASENGKPGITTPNASKFASDGIVFEQAFTAAPTCSPSRAALMTGRYPHANGVMGLCHRRFGFDLNQNERHAADYFNELGYYTAAVGIVHEVRDSAKAPYQTHIKNNSALDAGESLNQILAKRIDNNTPLFVSIGTSQTHRPYPKLEDKSQSSCKLPSFIPDTNQTRHDFAELEASLEQWDKGLGDVLNTLQKYNLEENTLVIVTTDHGLAMPRSKATLYDSGTGIFTMMRWPGKITPQSRSKEMISNIDILPTLLQAAGSDAPNNLHGQTLMPLLTGEGEFKRDQLFTEHTFHGDYTPMRAVRTAQYKYILNFYTGPHIRSPKDGSKWGAFREWELNTKNSPAPLQELYDLKNDPQETHNLLEDENPNTLKLTANLRTKLYSWMQETNDPLLDGTIENPGEIQARDLLTQKPEH